MAQSTPTSSLGFQDYFSTTLSSAVSASDTTIPLVSAPTGTEGFLVIEPDSTTNREIIMYTSKSGSSVVCGSVDDRGISGTTARAHGSGSIVKMIAVADMFEALQSGNGLSSSFALPSGAVDPEDLLAGTGTSWVWQDWTPTWANLTVGSGTVVAKYIQIGKHVTCYLSFIFGAGSAIGGLVTASLPVAAATRYGSNLNQVGVLTILDSGTLNLAGYVQISASTTVARLVSATANTTYVGYEGWTSTIPFTWATNDHFNCTFVYEAA